MTSPSPIALVATLLFALQPVQAQTVWRCGVEGAVVYQGEPCPGGRALDQPAARSATELAEARLVAERERALADRLARERRAVDARPLALAAGIPHTPDRLSPSMPPRPAVKLRPRRDAGDGTWPSDRPASRQRPG